MPDIVRTDIRAGIAHKPEVRCIRRSHRFRLCPVIAVVRELRLKKRLYLSRRLAGQNLLPAQGEQVKVRRPSIHAARQRQLRRRIDKQRVRGLRRSHFLRKHLRPPRSSATNSAQPSLTMRPFCCVLRVKLTPPIQTCGQFVKVTIRSFVHRSPAE